MNDSYILAVSGTHGTGKSTVMRGLDALNIPVVNTQIARSAQQLLGWDSLTIAQESENNMWQLQDTILALMFDRDQGINENKKLSVVERCPADMWAYTKMWCTRLGVDVQSKRAMLYKQKCRNLMNEYRGVFMLYPSVLVPFQAEANRADIQSRDEVQEDLIEFLRSGDHTMFPIAMADKDLRISTCASIFITEKAKYGSDY